MDAGAAAAAAAVSILSYYILGNINNTEIYRVVYLGIIFLTQANVLKTILIIKINYKAYFILIMIKCLHL